MRAAPHRRRSGSQWQVLSQWSASYCFHHLFCPIFATFFGVGTHCAGQRDCPHRVEAMKVQRKKVVLDGMSRRIGVNLFMLVRQQQTTCRTAIIYSCASKSGEKIDSETVILQASLKVECTSSDAPATSALASGSPPSAPGKRAPDPTRRRRRKSASCACAKESPQQQ